MPLLDDISTLFAANGITDATWKISLGIVKPTPDNIVAVLETGGGDVNQYSDPPVGEPTFSVIVRGTKHGYAAVRTKIQAIFDLLNQGSIGTSTYVYALTAGPLPLGEDQNERPELSWNFRVRRILP